MYERRFGGLEPFSNFKVQARNLIVQFLALQHSPEIVNTINWRFLVFQLRHVECDKTLQQYLDQKINCRVTIDQREASLDIFAKSKWVLT